MNLDRCHLHPPVEFVVLTTRWAAKRGSAIGHRATLGPTKVGDLIDFGTVSKGGRDTDSGRSDRSPSPVHPARRPGGGRGAAVAPFAARLGRRLLAVFAGDRGRRHGAR